MTIKRNVNMKSIESLKEDILSNPLCLMVFQKIKDVYLVGGFIRDCLIGISTKDFDFVIVDSDKRNNYYEILKSFLKCTIINFKKHDTIRVALKGGITYDFTFCQDLNDDLRRRDFTINAIAFNPKEGFHDPFNGIEDIQNRIIRIISEDNIRDDPVRIIRAFRFKSLLNGGTFSDSTIRAIKKYKRFLKFSPSERITLEFFKLLELKSPENVLFELMEYDILSSIIPFNIKDFEYFKKNLSSISEKIKASHQLFKNRLDEMIGQSLSRKGQLYLCSIITTPEALENSRLILSKAVKRRVEAFIKNINNNCLSLSTDLGELYDCFVSLEPIVLEKIISQGRFDLFSQYQRYELLKRHPLLNGRDIVSATRIPRSENIGHLKKLINREVFAGRIKSKEQALGYLKTIA